MAVSMDVIKRVVIQGSSEGLDKVEGELRKLTSTTDGVSVSFEKASRSQLSAEAAYKRLSASIDPTDRAQQQITRSTSTLDRALKQGIITQDEYAKRLGQIREKYSSAAAANDNMANSSKLARHELINLSRQVQDVGVSIYSGQPALTVFIQQGSQIADVFIASKASLADFGRQVLGFVARNPFLVLAGGVAALGAGVLVAASYLNNYVKVLDDLSRSSGIAAKDLSQLREAAAVKGVSNSDFVSGINSFAEKIDQAKKGTNELGQLFKLNGKAISDNVTNLYTVADLVKNAADYQDKKNILEAAGLSTTAESVRYYSQGAEELKKQKEAAAGFGAETEKLAANARAFDEAWNKAWESFKSYAVTSISESLAEIKKIASDPTVQAIIAFMSLTPEQAYGVWKGAVSRTIQRAKDWYNGTPAPSYNPGIPEGYEVVPPTQQYGPDLPKITETTKALKEQMRVLQDRISLLGESASAEDKLALAELKIKQALLEKIPLSYKDIAAIRANAVAVKEGAAERESAWDKATNAMSRHMAQTQADIATIGQSIEAQTQLKNEVKLLEAAKESDIGVTQQQIDIYIKLRATMSQISALKGAGISLDEGKLKTFLELPKADAKATETLKEQKKLYESLTNAASQFVTTIVEGFAKGENLAKTLQNALASLGNQLISMGSQNLVGNLFKATADNGQQAGGLLGGGLTSLLGLGSALAPGVGSIVALGVGTALTFFSQSKQKADQAAQAAAQAAQQLAEAQKQWASMAGQVSSWMAEWTTGFAGELGKAIESARSQMQQFANAASAAHDAAGVAAVQDAFNRGVTRSIQEAITALQNYGTEQSEVARQIEDVNNKSTDLKNVLVQWGVAAADAAQIVDTKLNAALERLRNNFLADIVRKINDLAGGTWINQLNDLVSEIAQLRQDAAALGIQTTQIDTYYVLAAQKVIDSNKLTGDAFNTVAQTLGPLGGQLHEFNAALEETAQAVKRTAEQIRQTIQSYQDQLFIAQQDQQTLAGALAVFDLQAQRAREEEVAQGGEALVALEALQAQQRLNIIADFNKKALEEQQRADEERLRQQQQAAEEQQRIWDEASKFLQNALQNIQGWISSFLAGAQSPLSPAGRLASAQSTFSTQYAAAIGGNRDALSGITGNAQALVDAIRAMYGSGATGQTLINQLLDQLNALPAQVSPEQFIVNQLNPSIQSTTTAVATNTSAIQSMQAALQSALSTSNPSAIASALSTYFSQLDTNVNDLLDYNELVSGLGGMANNSQLAAMFKTLDTDNSGSLSRLELINATASGTTSATNTVNSSIGGVKADTTAMNTSLLALAQVSNNTGTTSTNTANSYSALLNIANTLNTISGQIGNTGVSTSLVGEVERVRSNLVVQNANWGSGWATSPATYAAGQAIAQYGAGGYVDGPSHFYGGRNINVEGGEYVINKQATARNLPLLAAINSGSANDNNSNGELSELIARVASLEKTLVRAVAASGTLVASQVESLNETQRELNKRMKRAS